MKVDVLLGLQWGDEGKGKIVDVLTKNYDIIARFQGGPNAWKINFLFVYFLTITNLNYFFFGYQNLVG